jgi:hypothetical protein
MQKRNSLNALDRHGNTGGATHSGPPNRVAEFSARLIAQRINIGFSLGGALRFWRVKEAFEQERKRGLMVTPYNGPPPMDGRPQERKYWPLLHLREPNE